MSADVRITMEGSRVLIGPARPLGQTRFGAYRTTVRAAGAVAHPTRWEDYCSPVACPDLTRSLRAAGFSLSIDPAVGRHLRSVADSLESSMPTDADSRLHPYQREGMGYLRARTLAVLADEMGLGKTAQLLCAAHSAAPLLVICPALAKGVWQAEARLWTPDRRVYVLAGRGSFRWPRSGELVIINYDVLPPAGSALPPPQPGTILIADEAHYCKGATGRTRATAQLVRTVTGSAGGRAWAATGTPLANWPPDLYRVLATFRLAEPSFGSWNRFVSLFGGTKDRWGRWEWKRPHPSVPGILARSMLRRTRAQVLPQLPAKSYASIPVPLSLADASELEKLLTRAGIAAKEITAESLGRLLRSSHIMAARKLLAAAKIGHALDWADSMEDAGEPAVIFSAHRAPIVAFEKRPRWATITGDTAPAERSRIAEAFQLGQLSGIAATIDAGGVAITLTRAAVALFVDLEWIPAANSQAEDRLLRIGQSRPVTIYRLTTEHEVDQRVRDLLTHKAATLAASVEAISHTSDSARAQALRALADQIDMESL